MKSEAPTAKSNKPQNRLQKSLINRWMGREVLEPGGIWGRVQRVGLVPGVNTRPLIWEAPSTQSAVARRARFFSEYNIRDKLST